MPVQDAELKTVEPKYKATTPEAEQWAQIPRLALI